MYENLEGFRENCAIDGKSLDTYAKPYKKEKGHIKNKQKNIRSLVAYDKLSICGTRGILHSFLVGIKHKK